MHLPNLTNRSIWKRQSHAKQIEREARRMNLSCHMRKDVGLDCPEPRFSWLTLTR